MLDYVREGNTLYVESISRLGRSTKDLLNIIDTLTDKGVTLISHKESIDTDRHWGKFEPLYGEWKTKHITGRDFMRKMDLSANTFYRRVREYEITHGIAEQTSA